MRLTVEDITDLLKFIVTTTYFSFSGVIYQQMFGAAMGSPVSKLLANLFKKKRRTSRFHYWTLF